MARYLRPGATVVLESTTYPGTTEELVAPILEEGSGLTVGEDFHLGYSPERIDPGNQSWTFTNTPKVVSGVNAASLTAVQEFYASIVEQTVPVGSTQVAELTKLMENTFRHVNIALVNELAVFAHDLDIDVWEAIDAASTKPFGYMRFTPGPGVGGHCLPIDPSYLSWRVKRALGQNFRFVELANDVNDHMPEHVVRRLVVGLNDRSKAVRGSRILRPGAGVQEEHQRCPGVAVSSASSSSSSTSAPRSAPSIPTSSSITGAPAGMVRVLLTAEEVSAADAVVLLTDHDSFDLGMVMEHAGYVLDCRNRLSGENVEVL